ncbi:ABC transporter, ATPase subunit [Criblamydia sequanensis CRIB-18]|uniref:ABC transporter, ATPase subunit n=1 Tax=Candidatus Criblamydia sequanensis CRIB-18 TaxID=1437425 RepID=A0A090D0D6_9BACT|nr:ABC transporter, ATPase subunit [Criblamydia sequanensis CRIB-18]
MTTFLSIHSLTKFYGSQPLFKNISFTISQGDRIGLIGPNGAGKSTLLKILMDLEYPDEGHITKKQQLKVAYASQFPEFPSIPLEDLLVSEIKEKRSEEEDLILRTRAKKLLGKAQFNDFYTLANLLSGGWKKRFDIVRALMQEPDLLLLDEPTNHLDLDGILWLEEFLSKEKLSYLVVSHDRTFLNSIANKIIELNYLYPQGVFVSEGDLNLYQDRKEAYIEGEEARKKGLSSQLRKEVDWLRRSPKARTTKSEARVQKAYQLMDELADVKNRTKVKKVDIEFSASERETRKLLVAKNLSKSYEGKTLFEQADVTLSPGTRLGIVGSNGTGKTTLLKMLAGMIEPDLGTIKKALDLQIVYFDQHRDEVDGDLSLKEALSPANEMVNYRGQFIHVNGWAKKFLFPEERLKMPVRCLSGGERARILIAKLMLKPADILFLDEPTNDLDIQTLEVIESSLNEFPGAIVLISHDRMLMDRVCNQILGLGLTKAPELFASYSQWEKAAQAFSKPSQPSIKPKEEIKPSSLKKFPKLSYKEEKELEGIEGQIAAIEKKMALLQEKVNGSLGKDAAQLYNELADLQKNHESLFERWELLELKKQAAS